MTNCQNKIIGVFGQKGCGKTSLVKKLLSKFSQNKIYFDHIGEYGGAVVKGYRDFLYAIKSGEPEICARLPDLPTIDLALLFCARLKNKLIVIDELDAVSSPVNVPLGLSQICRYGRHNQLSLIFASRRPAEVPRICTSQADEIYSCRIIEPNDLKFLRSYSEKALRLPALSPMEYLRLV